MTESNEDDLELHDYNPEIVVGTYFNPKNCFGSGLHSAIASGNIKSVKKLIKNHYELNLTDARGYTALHIAIEYKSIEILKLLLRQPGIRCNVQNNIGETPLFLSLEMQLEEIASILINHGCDINIANYENVTPLHLAVRRKSVNIGRKLILKGADVNSKDRDGYTPLHEAATTNQFDNVCMLLYYNASANEKTIFSLATPFHMACNNHCTTETAKYLMHYVDDIDEMDAVGSTALHLALNSHSDFAMDLIEKEANVNVVVAETPCIYFSFFYKSCDIFESIWRNIDCKILLELKYPFLRMFIKNCKFPTDQFLKCLYIIFESPFIDHFLHQHITNYEESLFTFLAHKKLPQHEGIKINYLLLSHGVPVYFNDICILHDMYGFNETLELILTSGCCIELNRCNRFNLLASRICYDNFDMYTYRKDYFSNCIYECDKKGYGEFYSVPECISFNSGDELVSYSVWGKVRPLLELSRDIVRATIYKNCCKPSSFTVYNAFNTLQLPNKIRNILRLKEPLYSEH